LDKTSVYIIGKSGKNFRECRYRMLECQL